MSDENSVLAPSGVVICRAVAGDAAIIARHRVGMFRDMGQVPTDALAGRLLQESIIALSIGLGEGSYIGWLARDGKNRVVAGAGVHIKAHLPRITQDGTRVTSSAVPLVVNVYTEPDWRCRGLARSLMNTIMQWSMAQGFERLVLHASDAGHALYASLGFVPTNEMRWWPPVPSVSAGP